MAGKRTDKVRILPRRHFYLAQLSIGIMFRLGTQSFCETRYRSSQDQRKLPCESADLPSLCAGILSVKTVFQTTGALSKHREEKHLLHILGSAKGRSPVDNAAAPGAPRRRRLESLGQQGP